MEKIIKIVSVMSIILLISINFVYAVDMNLTENTSSEGTIQEESVNPSATDFDDKSTISTSTTVKTSNVSDSGLNLSNVLSIILIVVGILVVLLAIAILIKLK